MSDKLERDDYEDPACPFCVDRYQKEPPAKPIPIGRVIERLNEYFSRNDAAAAERHLLYWLAEAKAGRDRHGLFTLQNELAGFYRKRGEREKAIGFAEDALASGEAMGILDRASGATALINAGTVYKAFGMPEKSLTLFERALPVYEGELAPGDWRLGGLYNNMALTLADLSRWDEAEEYYRKALANMRLAENGEAEQAVTWLNLADLYAAKLGLEDASESIEDCLDRALELFDAPSLPRDGDYAYYCRTSAPTFRYFGRFADARELEERAEKIYESNR